MTKLYRISEKRYAKNPEGWDVWFVGWNSRGKPYAMAHKVKLPKRTPDETQPQRDT